MYEFACHEGNYSIVGVLRVRAFHENRRSRACSAEGRGLKWRSYSPPAGGPSKIGPTRGGASSAPTLPAGRSSDRPLSRGAPARCPRRSPAPSLPRRRPRGRGIGRSASRRAGRREAARREAAHSPSAEPIPVSRNRSAQHVNEHERAACAEREPDADLRHALADREPDRSVDRHAGQRRRQHRRHQKQQHRAARLREGPAIRSSIVLTS